MRRRTHDRDARWTSKEAKARKAKEDGTKAKVEITTPVFGYENHLGIDAAHRIIRSFAATSAAAHDGSRLPAVLAKNMASSVWADTAYRSHVDEKRFAVIGLRSKIHFRRQPGCDLTPSQKRANCARSKMRSVVEGVFAQQEYALGLVDRTVGSPERRRRSPSRTSSDGTSGSSNTPKEAFALEERAWTTAPDERRFEAGLAGMLRIIDGPCDPRRRVLRGAGPARMHGLSAAART